LAKAATLVGNPTALAACVYANRLGNGSEASGDGATFSGHGLIQLTGRAAFTALGASIGMTAEAAATYAARPAGAAASACWFWTGRKLNAIADAWSITLITGAVNGPSKLGLAARIAAGDAALHAMGR
jgi:putative chitinase